MSFTVSVAIKEGEAVVSTSGDVPDGSFDIFGHEDNSQRTLGVARRGADGRYVQQANAVHHKEVS